MDKNDIFVTEVKVLDIPEMENGSWTCAMEVYPV